MAIQKMMTFERGSFCFSVLNPRLLLITPPSVDNIVHTELEKGIQTLNFGDYQISAGDVIKIGKQKYKVQEITKGDKKSTHGEGYYLHVHKKISKTANFLMPLLGGTRSDYRWTGNFVNAFIGTEDTQDWGEFLYLLYRFDGSLEFTKTEEYLQNHPDFVEEIHPDEYHILFKFRIPESKTAEAKLLITGLYSKINESTKRQILAFHFSNADRPLGQILYKDPKLRLKMCKDLLGDIPLEAELYDPFYPEDEMYLNKYKIEKNYESTNSDAI